MRQQNMKWIIKASVVILLMPWAVSCASDDLGPLNLNPVDCNGFKTVTYLGDIKPIIDANCSRCHNSGFVGKDWTDPAQLKSRAKEAARRVQIPRGQLDHMPKDPPDLTEAEIKLIVCWYEQGAPI